DKNDLIYVADSESRDGRTNTGQFALPQTGYGFNPGIQRGIRIGSARDGSVKYFIPDPCPYPYPSGSSMAEGVTADAEGNIYGADFLGTIRKFVRRWPRSEPNTHKVPPACCKISLRTLVSRLQQARYDKLMH